MLLLLPLNAMLQLELVDLELGMPVKRHVIVESGMWIFKHNLLS